MSKYVKNLLIDAMRDRLAGVDHALLVELAGMDANRNCELRKELREREIEVMVIKNSLAGRATEGTPLAAAFEQMEGALAVVWGGEDIVSLAKVVTAMAEKKEYAPFAPRGGVMEGSRITADEVKQISKWPSRAEQLSILSGQILSVGGRLASQLTSVGGALASQIAKKAEGESGEGGDG